MGDKVGAEWRLLRGGGYWHLRWDIPAQGSCPSREAELLLRFAVEARSILSERSMTERKTSERSEEEVGLDLSRLVGFSAVGKTEVDFRDRTFAARIGAKRGAPEPEENEPSRD
jgi:hypothetical protein